MQESQISFDLENKSTTDDAVAILIPALLRRNKSLAGRFPSKVGDFKDETGNITITASNEGVAGQLAELDEFTAQLTDIQVVGICVTTDNLTQGTLNFMQKQSIEFTPAVVTNIETIATLEAGKSVVNHNFVTPFKTAALLSLTMKLLAGQKVNVCLRVVMPDLSGSSASLPVLPNQ